MHALFCRKVTQIQFALKQLISEKDVLFGLVYSYTSTYLHFRLLHAHQIMVIAL